jgi:hypothetical protein
VGNGNFIKFTDPVKFSLLDPNLIKIKDNYEGAFKPGGIGTPGETHPSGMGTVPGGAQFQQSQQPQKGLLVRIAATHAGIITGNNGFYLPDRMKKGASTFTDNFGKPILLHHEAKEDGVGRVVESAYLDTSGAIIDRYKDMVVKDRSGKQVAVINETLINDFCDGSMPYGMAVDTVRSVFSHSILDDQGYEGLGHIQLVANIVDSEAIKKLLDGRYLTGSVGASTNSASCSVCRQDWTELGQCEHKPGAIYDGQKCFIIAGDLTYSEYSFVNKPADRHSKVLELNYNGIQDSIQLENEYSGRIYEVCLQFPQYDSITTKEEQGMKTKPQENKDGQVELQDSATDQNTETVVDTAASGDTNTEVTDGENNTDGNVQTSGEETNVDGSSETTVQDSTGEESIEDLVIKVLEEDESIEFTDELDEKLYKVLWDEVLAAVNDGDVVIEATALEDAKLSSAARKKLPKSSFCGPGRSFPVPDCAHVTAARRLIGRAKVSDSTKSSILACVSRKAKAMGCGGSKSSSDSVVETQDSMDHSRVLRMVLSVLDEEYYNQEPVLNDDEKKALQTIIKRMAGLVGKDALVEASTVEGVALSDSAEDAYVNEITKHEETIGELRDRLEANRTEYHELLEDYKTVSDQLVEANANVRTQKEARLTTLKVLSDAKVDEADWTSLNDESLDAEVTRLTEEVDMTKIVDKLGDGMSRVPVGEVESPTQIQDDNNGNQKSILDVNVLQQIEDTYWELRLSRGEYAAEHFIARMKAEGKLPQDNENFQGGSN